MIHNQYLHIYHHLVMHIHKNKWDKKTISEYQLENIHMGLHDHTLTYSNSKHQIKERRREENAPYECVTFISSNTSLVVRCE